MGKIKIRIKKRRNYKCDKCGKDLPITVPPYQRRNWEVCECGEID